jgi:hypothetical protein
MPRTILAAFADRMTFANPVPLTFERWRIELLSGLTVALALVPEAVAFAFVAATAPFEYSKLAPPSTVSIDITWPSSSRSKRTMSRCGSVTASRSKPSPSQA